MLALYWALVKIPAIVTMIIYNDYIYYIQLHLNFTGQNSVIQSIPSLVLGAGFYRSRVNTHRCSHSRRRRWVPPASCHDSAPWCPNRSCRWGWALPPAGRGTEQKRGEGGGGVRLSVNLTASLYKWRQQSGLLCPATVAECRHVY